MKSSKTTRLRLLLLWSIMPVFLICTNTFAPILSVNSRAHFLKHLTQQARANGILPFVWAGGIFDRTTNTISDQWILCGQGQAFKITI